MDKKITRAKQVEEVVKVLNKWWLGIDYNFWPKNLMEILTKFKRLVKKYGVRRIKLGKC